eukprot:EG_transcript_17783
MRCLRGVAPPPLTRCSCDLTFTVSRKHHFAQVQKTASTLSTESLLLLICPDATDWLKSLQHLRLVIRYPPFPRLFGCHAQETSINNTPDGAFNGSLQGVSSDSSPLGGSRQLHPDIGASTVVPIQCCFNPSISPLPEIS